MGKLDEKTYLEKRIKETKKRFATKTKISFKRSKEYPLNRLFAELQLSCYTDIVELKILLEIYETYYGQGFRDLKNETEKGIDKLKMNIDENWGICLEKVLCNNLN